MKYLVKTAKGHMHRCKIAARNDADSFFRVCLLAVASARIHSKTFWLSYINSINELMEEGKTFDEIHEIVPFMSMQFKRNALMHLQENRHELWNLMKSMNSNQFHDYLCKTVPGLGPVKAGFIVQMCHNKLGCVDTVNLKRLGISKTSPVPRLYRKQLKDIGETSERMWHVWCVSVADRQNKVKDKLNWSANGLSEAHALFVERGKFNPEMVATHV